MQITLRRQGSQSDPPKPPSRTPLIWPLGLNEGAPNLYPSLSDICSLVKLSIPSDGVDRDTGGESGHLLKMSLLALGSFWAGVPIHLQCPDPPRVTVIEGRMHGRFYLRAYWAQGLAPGGASRPGDLPPEKKKQN